MAFIQFYFSFLHHKSFPRFMAAATSRSFTSDFQSQLPRCIFQPHALIQSSASSIHEDTSCLQLCEDTSCLQLYEDTSCMHLCHRQLSSCNFVIFNSPLRSCKSIHLWHLPFRFHDPDPFLALERKATQAYSITYSTYIKSRSTAPLLSICCIHE